MNTNTIRIAAACIALALTSQGRSAELAVPKDGWASWQVDAVENAPAWCCFDWDNGKNSTPATCKLDGDNHGYGSRDEAKTSAVRIYAKFAGGKIQRLRSLAAACPVETKSPIQKLENVSTDDSARWLISLAKTAPMGKHEMGEDLLAAIGMHRGDVAFSALRDTARNEADTEQRKRAIFWLAELRGEPGADVVSSTMFTDKDPEVRKHAGFSMTLSKSPRIGAELIKQGNTDKDGDVRAQAWFWLAHTGAPNAEAPIIAAANKDADDHVREQAIFALSQLPDERAVPALIKAAEDRSLSREQRKRALFWLGQSESPAATAYIDKVLMGSR
jgi:HEAT repeat protein